LDRSDELPDIIPEPADPPAVLDGDPAVICAPVGYKIAGLYLEKVVKFN
jgi:hypothetical protein